MLTLTSIVRQLPLATVVCPGSLHRDIIRSSAISRPRINCVSPAVPVLEVG